MFQKSKSSINYLKNIFSNSNTINIIKYLPKKRFVREAMPQKLKHKFYTKVEILEVEKSENVEKRTENEDREVQKRTDIFLKNGNKIMDKLTNLFGYDNYNYYILLDKKKCKSMFLDEYIIPNRNLALLLAEEWACQKDFINLHSMHLNFYASTAIRLRKDTEYRENVISTIGNYMETDQILFLEPHILQFIESEQVKQNEEYEVIFDVISKVETFMNENFNINIKIPTLDTFVNEDTNCKENKKKLIHFLKNCDIWVLSLLEQLVGLTKSPSISLALINNIITPHQAYFLSQSEEYYQMKINGEVEGHHDISSEMILGKIHSALCFNKISYL